MYLEYTKFKSIFNSAIFGKPKPDLLKNIANHPNRYVGIFRPSLTKTKILQNLLQSYEIKFGDVFETLITKYLEVKNFENINEELEDNEGELKPDQMFLKNNILYFVEQKIRDDHDSTKKRGQVKNFIRKAVAINKKYKDKEIHGFFYFIDDSFTKNKNFYRDELEKESNRLKIPLKLSYGEKFFDALQISECWKEILNYLTRWKKELPALPEVNFDKNPTQSFKEIKILEPKIFNKLFSNEKLDKLLLVIFP